jgi:hypothetical protein
MRTECRRRRRLNYDTSTHGEEGCEHNNAVSLFVAGGRRDKADNVSLAECENAQQNHIRGESPAAVTAKNINLDTDSHSHTDPQQPWVLDLEHEICLAEHGKCCHENSDHELD